MHDRLEAHGGPSRPGLLNGPGGPQRSPRLVGGGLSSGGSGRTNGGGLTNGSGRTNGGGRTNGSGGRTNGSGGRVSGVHGRAAAARAARRSRRKAGAALAGSLLVVVSVGLALGLSGSPTDGFRIDGSLAEWSGHLQATPPGGPVVEFGLADSSSGPLAAFTFAEPLTSRADVWLFLDTDLVGSTGFFTGSLGADEAVVVRMDAGHVISASALRFQGRDAFDLNGLVAAGPAAAQAKGVSLEVALPGVPRALQVAVASPDGAASTVSFTTGGQPIHLAPRLAPTSGEVWNGVRIDGEFSDWADVPLVADLPSDAVPGRLDIVSTAAIGDANSAQFLVDAREGVLTGTLPLRAASISSGPTAAQPAPSVPPRRVSGTDLLEVYIDADNDAATGASAFGLGAEFMLRVEGVSGFVVSTEVYGVDPGGAWELLPTLAEAAAGGGSVEASVRVDGLVGADVRFVLEGFDGSDASTAHVSVGALSGGAAPSPTLTGSVAPVAGGLDVAPIPELSEVATVAAGALLIVVLGRRHGRRRGGAQVTL